MPSVLSGDLLEFIVKSSQPQPRLSPADWVVWEKFQRLLDPDISFVRYDLRLGQGRTPLPSVTRAEAGMWTALTQYRIDAVICTDQTAYLIEIKPVVNHLLLGQLWTYEESLQGTPLESSSVKLVGLCDWGHEHIESIGRVGRLNICCLSDMSTCRMHLGPLLRKELPTQLPNLPRYAGK